MQLAVLGRLRRGANVLRVAAESLSTDPIDLPGPFFVKSGYVHREDPAYDDAFRTPGIVWQPRVYVVAAAVATAVGSIRIVDVGAGNGAKLASLRDSFDLIGIDVGANLERARDEYPFIHWVERDLETAHDLGVGPELLKGAVVVYADVIEHLRRPDRVLTILQRDGAGGEP
jgi:2-polyprenyl-3-methyl-5-hydroxy-6-metoxy-1,4-benzoquinol methylase